MCTRCVEMCTDVYKKKMAPPLRSFLMCTRCVQMCTKMCTGCVQSLVHLSADPNFCNVCICNGYICPTATFSQLLHLPKRLHSSQLHLPNGYIFPNGYICPTATFVATTFALAAASGGAGAPLAPASAAAPTCARRQRRRRFLMCTRCVQLCTDVNEKKWRWH